MPSFEIWDSAETAHIHVEFPAWGYNVEIHQPICTTKAASGGYPDNAFFDPPNEDTPAVYGTFDFRILNIPSIKLSATDQAAFTAFFKNVAYGRGENVIIKLGVTPTGFFPGGTEYGDVGDFEVRLLEQKVSEMLYSPYEYFENNLKFIIVDPPAYTPAFDDYDEGVIQIGACDHKFKYPTGWFIPNISYNIKNEYSISGVPNSLDMPLHSDTWISSFTMECSTYNSDSLIAELLSKRTNNIQLIIPAGYPFGIDGGVGGTYNCKFLGSSFSDKERIIKTVHTGYNRFETHLSFWLKEKLA
jgi:hypothetical protein